MPAERKIDKRGIYPPDCIFAAPSFKGFLGAAANQGIVTSGTLTEVDTPRGCGISVGAANAYFRLNLTGFLPLTVAPRTIIARAYFPDNSSTYALAAWGANVTRDGFLLENASGTLLGGFVDDSDSAGAISAAWLTLGVSNVGTNGGANTVYLQGAPTVAGTNAGAGVTATSNIYVFRTPWGTMQCPVGTILLSLFVFSRVLSAAEHLAAHNMIIGNSL